MRKSLRKITAAAAACTMALALAVSAVPNTADASVDCSKAGKKAGKADIDLDGTYHAYFGFQQSGSWVFRNSWSEPTLGQDGKNLGDLSYDSILQSADGGVTALDGTITDAEIAGNGTYTVGVSGLNGCIPQDDGSETAISMIFASTDIPSAAIDDGTITISDVKLSTDGNESWNGDPYENADAQEWGLYEMDIVNTYQQDGYTSPSVLVPNDSMTITFTVSGFNYDNPDATGATSDTSSATSTSGTTSSTSSESSDSGMSTGAVAGIVIVAVVVIAGVVFFVTKKKK